MKKPKRLTADELAAVVEKRADRKVSVEKLLPSGNWQVLAEAIGEFAQKVGVDPHDVHISNAGSYYYRARMKASRPETAEEKFKRIKADEDYKYRNKKAQYDTWLRQEEYRKAQEARQVANVVIQKSNCKCCCCK